MWLLHPPKSRRRWHVFTWLMAVPALVFVALVQVAGVEPDEPPQLITPVPQWYLKNWLSSGTLVPYPQLTSELEQTILSLPINVNEYQHGWPTPWLRRAIGHGNAPIYGPAGPYQPQGRWPDEASTQYVLDWQEPDAWPFTADRWKVAPLGFAVNLLVAVIIAAAMMTATEVWLRRRGGPFRFKLLDIGIATTLIVAGLALWKFDRQAVQREAEIMERFHATQTRSNKVETGYIGPEWLARLCGGERHVPVLQRVTLLWIGDVPGSRLDVTPLERLRHLKTIVYDSPTIAEQVVKDIQPLRAVREIVIPRDYPGRTTARVLRALKDLPGIESLSIRGSALFEELEILVHFKDLKCLKLNTDLLTDQELQQLRDKLRGVEIVSTGDAVKSPCQAEQIEAARIAQRYLGACEVSDDGRRLRVAFIPFDIEHLEPLASVYNRIEEFELMGRAIPTGGTELLVRMDSLKDVNLCVAELSEEFLLELASRPQLRRVVLRNGKPSVKAMLRLSENQDCQLFVAQRWFTEGEFEQLQSAFGDRLQLR